MGSPRPKQRGARNPAWKGGRTVASNGYVLIRVGKEHHLADVRGYAYEHRLVAEQKLGRRLQPGEIPHHIDGNKQNNDPGNIEVVASAAHHHRHHRKHERGLREPGEDNPTIACACGCGTTLRRYDSSGRPRTYVSGHNRAPAPQQDAVLSILRARGELPRAAIAAALGSTAGRVGTNLNVMRRKGLIAPGAGRGTWRAA